MVYGFIASATRCMFQAVYLGLEDSDVLAVAAGRC